MADPCEKYRFGDFEADVRAGELRKQGRKVRLAGRPMDILALLLERPGELLTRKELQEKLWPADTFVDFEHGVNAAVQVLRQALCDSHKNPRFVETLPRRGYRFIAPVERVARRAAGGAAVQEAAGSAGAVSALVGCGGVVVDPGAKNFVLLPRDETFLDEMEACEKAQDDLGISLLVSDGKLLMVACGTRVKILEVSATGRGCTARILGGEFIGERAFVPKKHLQVAEGSEGNDAKSASA
jgi:DNA-binding winged helix-turn-helix (wHTH) protein